MRERMLSALSLVMLSLVSVLNCAIGRLSETSLMIVAGYEEQGIDIVVRECCFFPSFSRLDS